MYTYRISMDIFSVYPFLNIVWKFIKKTDTLYILFCICAQQEEEENVRNFLKYWIIIFLIWYIAFSFLPPTWLTASIIFQSDFSNSTMWFWFFEHHWNERQKTVILMPGQFDGDDLFFFVKKVLKCFGKAGPV